MSSPHHRHLFCHHHVAMAQSTTTQMPPPTHYESTGSNSTTLVSPTSPCFSYSAAGGRLPSSAPPPAPSHQPVKFYWPPSDAPLNRHPPDQLYSYGAPFAHNDLPSKSVGGPNPSRSRQSASSGVVVRGERSHTYWEKRRRNNESARRSRLTRRYREHENAMKCYLLERENLQLHTELTMLQYEIEKLKVMLYTTCASTSASATVSDEQRASGVTPTPPEQHQQAFLN